MIITKAIRNQISNIVNDSAEYDAETVRISRDGEVTAKKDANKTFNGSDSARYLVGHAADMISDIY